VCSRFHNVELARGGEGEGNERERERERERTQRDERKFAEYNEYYEVIEEVRG